MSMLAPMQTTRCVCVYFIVTSIAIHAFEGEFERHKPAALWLNELEPPWKPSERLERVLKRVGPNIRASTNYHDYNDIGFNESLEAWHLLHEQAKRIAREQVDLYRFDIDKLLRDSQVSSQCRRSFVQTFDSMARLDSWALEMWSATSNFPPVGLIDGHVTEVGSYRGCIDIEPPINTTRDFQHTSYCLVAFRPVIPSRPRFHSVFQKVPSKLIDFFDQRDFFHKLASQAQYFYYLYRKTAVCVPFTCTPADIQQVSNLVAHRLALTTGPVKCWSRAPLEETNSSLEVYLRHEIDDFDSTIIENEPILIQLGRAPNRKQIISLIIVCSFFFIVFASTTWHAIELLRIRIAKPRCIYTNNESCENGKHSDMERNPRADHMIQENQNDQDIEVPVPTPDPKRRRQSLLVSQSHGIKFVAVHYFSIITNVHEFLNTSLRSNEIRCLHGFRVLTMFWIICVHTMQYNEWSGFTRVFAVEISLKDPLMQPMINANYVVDNFFLMSGLLVSYTTWFANKGVATNFSISTSLLSRYLRLTPQALLVSLLYILLPLAGHGPFWYDMTHEAAKNCEKNWWVNMLHLQSFYRYDEMCNLVSWWISVDMLYYIVALFLISMMLGGKVKQAAICSGIFVAYCITATVYRHYYMGFTPNNLGNVPQIGEVWTEYVVFFFWSPFPHAYIYFIGLWIGYALATKRCKDFVQRWSSLGCALSVLCLILVNVSSHIWVSGLVEPKNQFISTAYNLVCNIVWANAFGWIIMALHYGNFPSFNRVLSMDVCILLSKASFIIYLSHMLIVRIAFGKQYTTLEVSTGTIIYIMVGNILFSVILGIFLCVTFEGPCMKFQRYIITRLQPQRLKTTRTSVTTNGLGIHEQNLKSSIGLGPATTVLLK